MGDMKDDDRCTNCGHERWCHYFKETAPEWLVLRAEGEMLIGREQHARPMKEGWCWYDRYDYRPTCNCREWGEPDGVQRIDITIWTKTGEVSAHSHLTTNGSDPETPLAWVPSPETVAEILASTGDRFSEEMT